MNKEEFTKHILTEERKMYHIAKSILYRDEDCADAMQNAILAAYRNLDKLKKESYFQTWLIRILMNECYQMLREKKNIISYEEYMTEREETSDNCIENKEENSYVFSEIMKLTDKNRIPFILYYVEGFSVKETAKILSLTEDVIKKRLHRSREQLKVSLKGELL